MVIRGVLIVVMTGFLWLGQAWLAYGLFVGLSPSFGEAWAAVATVGFCIALLGLAALCWPRGSAAVPAASAASELANLAKVAEEHPFLGVALSALIGAGKAIEQGRSRP
jgi:hypothetical protein